MMQAREPAHDPFDVLDEAIGWSRLIAARDEIDALGDLATEDPLSLAASRYAPSAASSWPSTRPPHHCAMHARTRSRVTPRARAGLCASHCGSSIVAGTASR